MSIEKYNQYPAEIAHEQWSWMVKIDGHHHKLPMNVQIAPGALDLGNNAPSILIGGYGEGARSATAGLYALLHASEQNSSVPAVGIVTLPYRMLAPSAANLERVLVEGPHFIAEEIKRRTGRPSQSKSSLLGRSGGGGIALLSAHGAPELFDHVGALSPVGVTSELMGSAPDEVRREFRRRVLRNILRREQSPLLSGNVRAGREIASHAWKGARLRRVIPELNFGLNQDGPRIIRELVDNGVDIGILGADRDVFRSAEYRAALGRVGLDHIFRQIPGSHSNSLSRAGWKQMGHLADWLTEAQARV